jgi:hypothetical protein
VNSVLRKAQRIRLKAQAYRALHRSILERDGWRCQACGSMSNLEIHHSAPGQTWCFQRRSVRREATQVLQMARVSVAWAGLRGEGRAGLAEGNGAATQPGRPGELDSHSLARSINCVKQVLTSRSSAVLSGEGRVTGF